MRDGKYEVTKFIHVFKCLEGQLKLPKGTEVVINGIVASVDGVKFPTSLLKGVESHLKKMD